jgi:phosphatidylserine decarboxylase
LGFLVGAYRFFHRDPDRFVERRQNSVLSAADGTIFSIEQINFPELVNQPGINDIGGTAVKSFWNDHERFWTISIFMSVLDVHVNRSPISGTVLTIAHKPGKFRPLFPERKEEHSQNERNIVIIKNGAMTVAVVQIAGHIARKIECWVDPGDFLEQGDRLGWIRMGSRVDVIFPALDNLAVEVREGVHVKAGIDSLATIPRLDHRSIAFGPENVPSKDTITNRLLTKCLIWALYVYLYGKIAIFAFINRTTKAIGKLVNEEGS